VGLWTALQVGRSDKATLIEVSQHSRIAEPD
jgi:hypothetical protein